MWEHCQEVLLIECKRFSCYFENVLLNQSYAFITDADTQCFETRSICTFSSNSVHVGIVYDSDSFSSPLPLTFHNFSVSPSSSYLDYNQGFLNKGFPSLFNFRTHTWLKLNKPLTNVAEELSVGYSIFCLQKCKEIVKDMLGTTASN